jgi:RNA polymerase sigma-70 factor, ECF subfamily
MRSPSSNEFVTDPATVYAEWLKREVLRKSEQARGNNNSMELDNQTVLGLLERVGKGDETAFTTLYRSVNRRVFAFALNQLRDEARAEEVVVDTLHEVWKHPERFNATSKFSTWVLGIARYKILNAFRSSTHSYDELTDEMSETVASDDASPHDLLANNQRQAGVRECMDKLTTDHRECMHLVFFEGMSLGEVATLQACPENTIKTRLFHARQKIKNCLRLLLKREGEETGGKENAEDALSAHDNSEGSANVTS